jgi:adenylate cyclase
LNAQEAERQKNLAEKEKRIGELELTQVKTRSRNLIYFAAGLLLLIVGAIITLLILRSKNKRIKKQNETILENQRVIQIEKEKSDRLLLNILPPVVAAELKETNRYKPRMYDEASILFTDFSKFTTIAENMSPEEMIGTLDRIFLAFDNICEKHGLNRIKTIGDAYMCVAGLPEPDAHHAHNAVSAALDMRDFMRDFNHKSEAEGGPEWAIRIGINSGPVIAGVVGIKKFAYDVWGDAVNTASRMESSGEIDHVNISGTTWELVHSRFNCTSRGKISAKNKGEIEMYFVDRKS